MRDPEPTGAGGAPGFDGNIAKRRDWPVPIGNVHVQARACCMTIQSPVERHALRRPNWKALNRAIRRGLARQQLSLFVARPITALQPGLSTVSKVESANLN